MNPVGNYDTGVGTGAHDGGLHEPKRVDELDNKSPMEKHAFGTESQHSDAFVTLAEAESGHDIKLRTMSWQKCAVLLFGEYVCLAIAAQAWSFSVLGYVPGMLITLGTGCIAWYTSYTLWRYQMAHPEVRDICDIGYLLFGKSQVAYEITAIMLLLNNLGLIGFHVLTGAKILNTLTDHSQCTVVFSAVTAIMGIIVSLPRTLNHVSTMSIVSAICMFIALVLSLSFAAKEANPAFGYGGLYPKLGANVYSTAFPPVSTTFIDGMNAALNITFLWVGQILYPSFIAEMKRPQDFPKALAALSIAEFALFSVPAIVGYRYLGQYATAPLFGSLQTNYKKISFGFVIVPTVIIGAIYSNVSCKYMFHRVMRNSRHAYSNSVIGWGVWIGCVLVTWVIAFIFAEVIPSFGDFLSLLSASFDGFFGFMWWSVAYFSLEKGRLFTTPLKAALTLLNVVIFGLGLTMLGPGLYTSIEQIKIDYETVAPLFACADNGL